MWGGGSGKSRGKLPVTATAERDSPPANQRKTQLNHSPLTITSQHTCRIILVLSQTCNKLPPIMNPNTDLQLVPEKNDGASSDEESIKLVWQDDEGTEVEIGEEKLFLFREEDILGKFD